MAEYFSKGRIDPLTSMWIRDATIHNRLPDLRKLTRDPRYFPYRYGEALLAYIGGRFGDEAVVRYFLAAGLIGIEPAFDRVLGISAKQLFTDWQESSRELYNPVVATRPMTLGRPLLGKKTTRGDLNIGPAISPDGRYLAFLSTRELFDIDLFLADAHTGQVIRRLISSDRDAHYDALRFIDSGGTWSPDSKRIAFIVYEKGDNYLGIVDTESRHIDHIRVPGLDAITNVAWSPDGHTIALAGQRTGVTDLFLYDFDTKSVKQLTNDKYADLQPAYSPDGKTIAFVSDRGGQTEFGTLKYGDMHIATIDVDTARVRVLPLFENAKNINPQYAPDGNSLYFIGNPEGVSDIYRYYFTDNHIERVTAVQTGVAGITEMSPALGVAAKSGDLVFSLYEDDDYNIYTLPGSTPGVAVAAVTAPEAPRAAILPPLRATGSQITSYLTHPEEGLMTSTSTFTRRGYNPALHVAYVGPPTIGVGAYFTDILGQHNVGFTVEGGGSNYGGVSFADQIGAEVFYLNQQHRFNWGADVTHIPYVGISTAVGQAIVPVNGQPTLADIYQQITQVETIDDVSGVTQYPFSTTRRIEAQLGVQRFAYKANVETLTVVGGSIIDDTRERLPGSFTLNLSKGSLAFVGDSSVFGFVSPVRGTRYRYEVGAMSGDLKFTTALADWRKYFFFRPVTIAVRGIHYGRYGHDAENGFLQPLDLGYTWLVRGYDGININECVSPGAPAGTCPVYDRIVGSRIAAGSVEMRLPLLGTKEFGLINAPAVPTELETFVDVGTAWNSGQTPKLKFQTNTPERVPVVSVGVGTRILLSYIPIEIYAAKPFQRPSKNIVYGFNILPGW
jgi:WD40 repeat protein